VSAEDLLEEIEGEFEYIETVLYAISLKDKEK